MYGKITSALFVALAGSVYGMTSSHAVPIAPPSVQVMDEADGLQLVARRYYHRRAYHGGRVYHGGRYRYGHRYGYRYGAYRRYGAYGYGVYGAYTGTWCRRPDGTLGYCNYGYPTSGVYSGYGGYPGYYRRYGYSGTVGFYGGRRYYGNRGHHVRHYRRYHRRR